MWFTEMNTNCPICKRVVPEGKWEKHHLTPACLSKRNKYKKVLGDNIDEKLLLCVNCGDQLHNLFSEKELAEDYNTLVKILACPSVQEWVGWVSKKPNDFSICMKTKKRK